MKINSISNYNFKSQMLDAYITTQTTQIMRDNMSILEQESYNTVATKIDKEFKDEFIRIINSQSKKVNPNDCKVVLQEIQRAYEEAGLNEDAKILKEHLSTFA